MVNAPNITYFKGQLQLLSRVNASLQKGSILIIKGPNGTGKSTLLRLLSGLTAQSRGALRGPCKGLSAKQHFLTHTYQLDLELTVHENLRFLCTLYNQKESSFARFLSIAKLTSVEDMKVKYLSEGQKRRVQMIQLALIPAPQWFLDEPVASLDEGAVSILRRIIRRHHQAGGSAVMSTHFPFLSTSVHIVEL